MVENDLPKHKNGDQFIIGCNTFGLSYHFMVSILSLPSPTHNAVQPQCVYLDPPPRSMSCKQRLWLEQVQCSLRQMLENGFFHADPHAGNLLALPNGKLCYLDFGMVSGVTKVFAEPSSSYP